MSLELICKLYLVMGYPVNSILKKENIVFKRNEFIKRLKNAPPLQVLIWDDINFSMHPRTRMMETWALWSWYLFQKWSFKND